MVLQGRWPVLPRLCWKIVWLEIQGERKTYTTRNTKKVNIRGDLRSLDLVAYSVNGIEKKSVVRLNASWRIEIFPRSGLEAKV